MCFFSWSILPLWGLRNHPLLQVTGERFIPLSFKLKVLHLRVGFMNWEKSGHRLEVPAKRYRIGELVRYSPFSRQTIHNYTIMGLIREAEWTEGGHRLYDETVFDRLSRIMELKESMSLTEIRRVLNEEEKTGSNSRYDAQARQRVAGTKGEDFMSPKAT